jgi:uncharacterized RDD family membrane protein YckC
MDATTSPEVRYCAECGRPAAPDDFARFGDILICPDCKSRYAQKLREGVTLPAAGMRYAGFWIRFVATLIDSIILAVGWAAVSSAVFRGSGFRAPEIQPGQSPDEALGAVAGVFGLLGLIWAIGTVIACVYEALFISRLGATPGKMALGLKVVRPNGAPVEFSRAAGRYFAKILSGLILYIGYIIAGFDAQKRALHDMICDTRVVKAEV